VGAAYALCHFSTPVSLPLPLPLPPFLCFGENEVCAGGKKVNGRRFDNGLRSWTLFSFLSPPFLPSPLFERECNGSQEKAAFSFFLPPLFPSTLR